MEGIENVRVLDISEFSLYPLNDAKSYEAARFSGTGHASRGLVER